MYVSESLKDIFKPKSQEEIRKHMKDVSIEEKESIITNLSLSKFSGDYGSAIYYLENLFTDKALERIRNTMVNIVGDAEERDDVSLDYIYINYMGDDELEIFLTAMNEKDIEKCLKELIPGYISESSCELMKFVNEDIKDFFIPKSEEEIMSLMGDLNLNDLLHRSAESGFLPGVKRAIEKGVDVHAFNDDALRNASLNDHYNVVKLLLNNGADVHANDDYALRSASFHGHYDVVKLLLDNGADVNAKNDSALRNASIHGYTDIIKLLKK